MRDPNKPLDLTAERDRDIETLTIPVMCERCANDGKNNAFSTWRAYDSHIRAGHPTQDMQERLAHEDACRKASDDLGVQR